MTKRIHIYELESYKQASEEKLSKMRICKIRYFDLEGLPSDSVRSMLESFIWERGRILSPSSLATELIYYNNIREFLIKKNIQEIRAKDENKLVRLLRGWMLEQGYALTSRKYRQAYNMFGQETSAIIRHLKKFLRFVEGNGEQVKEQEKDIWNLDKLSFPIRSNPIKRVKTINFTKIPQVDIRNEVKRVIFMHLKQCPMGTIQAEMTAIKRFTMYLHNRCGEVLSLQSLNRKHIEDYLIYLRTEASERKNYRTDLYSLRRVIDDVGNLYECPSLFQLFLNNDFPTEPRQLPRYYTDNEIKRLNSFIFKMDEQICRSLMIHQLLGTRISDTFTLRTDCLRIKSGKYFIRIDQVKSNMFEKAISDELAELIIKAIEYTKEHYGDTEYIFVNKDNPNEPYQYAMIQSKIMIMIMQNKIKDDNGELLKFGTHIFRACYGKKLTEMHVEDWIIARLLGHKTLRSVHHYRRIGNKIMADETREVRENMDMILLDVIKGWDGYEI